MGQIKIKDHLSPAEAEVGAELGNRFPDALSNHSEKDVVFGVLHSLRSVVTELRQDDPSLLNSTPDLVHLLLSENTRKS